MRIAISSTQLNGKTTLVNAFKAKWPMYVSPEKTYRDIIQEKGLSINRQGGAESQAVIRDALFEQAHSYGDTKFCISDRSILDNLVYTMYLEEKGKLDDDDFITESILMCRDALKKYDIIFWLPLNSGIKIDDLTNPNRDSDPVFRQEIDNIFTTVYEQYMSNSCIFFDPVDQPAFIPLVGDLNEKLQTISEYIGKDGNLVEEESILTTMENEWDKLQLLKEFESTMQKSK
jgi:hypothetical protein